MHLNGLSKRFEDFRLQGNEDCRSTRLAVSCRRVLRIPNVLRFNGLAWSGAAAVALPEIGRHLLSRECRHLVCLSPRSVPEDLAGAAPCRKTSSSDASRTSKQSTSRKTLPPCHLLYPRVPPGFRRLGDKVFIPEDFGQLAGLAAKLPSLRFPSKKEATLKGDRRSSPPSRLCINVNLVGMSLTWGHRRSQPQSLTPHDSQTHGGLVVAFDHEGFQPLAR